MGIPQPAQISFNILHGIGKCWYKITTAVSSMKKFTRAFRVTRVPFPLQDLCHKVPYETGKLYPSTTRSTNLGAVCTSVVVVAYCSHTSRIKVDLTSTRVAWSNLDPLWQAHRANYEVDSGQNIRYNWKIMINDSRLRPEHISVTFSLVVVSYWGNGRNVAITNGRLILLGKRTGLVRRREKWDVVGVGDYGITVQRTN